MLAALSPLKGYAQELLGTTGGVNTPSADMDAPGTFRGGINVIGKDLITPRAGEIDHPWLFNYTTYIYYGSFTIFNWLEAGIRETLLETYQDQKYRFRNQDRSVWLKVRVLKEGRSWPSLAFGAQDPFSVGGHHIYSSVWGAATKHFYFSYSRTGIGMTLGYTAALDHAEMYDGVFGSIRFEPFWLPDGGVSVEYDTHGWNVGLQALLWKHIGFYAFARNLAHYSAGLRYQTTIKYKSKR